MGNGFITSGNPALRLHGGAGAPAPTGGLNADISARRTGYYLSAEILMLTS